MKPAAIERKVATLSPRAQALWERVRRGDWYAAYSDRTPAAMKELQEAGLVGIAMRAKVFEAAFVPVGYKPAKPDRFPLC